MKSAGNGGVLKGILQVLHIHILFVAPLGTSYMAGSVKNFAQIGLQILV